jgi:hypothetical protein
VEARHENQPRKAAVDRSVSGPGSNRHGQTTWYVDGVNGNDKNDCKSPETACKSIGHAISLASSGDSISAAAAIYTENLTIGINLKLIGASASNTIMDGAARNTVVTIPSPSTTVNVSGFTVRNGLARIGGGISNFGTLRINDCTISGNSTTNGNSAGGGIYNNGALTINRSTISGNSQQIIGVGGGIANFGILTINTSTISDNSGGDGGGGGIANSGTLAISSSTISGNSATGSGGGIQGTATLQDSIISNNTSGGNCSGTMTSNGYNLSSDGSCNFNGTGDLNNTDPKLGPLRNNGGPTQTQTLLSGSPAIDAGNPSGCTDSQGHLLKTDQRGKPRPDKEDTSGCDMGAYERQTD